MKQVNDTIWEFDRYISRINKEIPRLNNVWLLLKTTKFAKPANVQ